MKGMVLQIDTLKNYCQEKDNQLKQLNLRLIKAEKELTLKQEEIDFNRMSQASKDEETFKVYESKIQNVLKEMEEANTHRLQLIEKNKELDHELEEKRNDVNRMAENYQAHIEEFEQLLAKISEEKGSPLAMEVEPSEVNFYKSLIERQELEIKAKNSEIIVLYEKLAQNENICVTQSIEFLKEMVHEKSDLVKIALEKAYHAQAIIKELSEQIELRKGLPEQIEKQTQ